MKHNWTFKKLGEVATLTGGFTPKADELFSEGKYPYFKVSDMNTAGNEVVLTKTPSFVVDSKKCYPKGAIVFPKNGAAVSTNKKRILGQDSIVDLNTCAAILNSDIDIKFAYYWFYNLDFKTLVRGGALPTLDLKGLRSLQLPIPSLDEQESIVAELDGINHLIDLQEEQLREYDRLAQSLFYTTFGDPVSNPKGWEVKKLGEVCKFSQGMQAPIEEQYDECKDGYTQFLRIIDFTQGKDAPRYVKCTDEKYILHDGEIAIVRYGTPGFVCYGKKGAIANNLFKITPINDNLFVYDYLRYWLQTDAFQQTVKGNQYGAALQAIKFNTISSIATILPPLALQQSFAAQIETIEQQKALIRRSLEHTRTLLAARMQYYFE